MKSIRILNLVICSLTCYFCHAQIDSLLSRLDIQYVDSFPAKFSLDEYCVPVDSEWVNIQLSREIEIKHFNPFISRAGYDYSFYEYGDETPMVILKAFEHNGGRFILYMTGSFGRSYYLADISSGENYPPTLLIHYFIADMNPISYSYNSQTNEIVISCLDNDIRRIDMIYGFDKGFPFKGCKFFRGIQTADKYDYIVRMNSVVWEEISESEWNNL